MNQADRNASVAHAQNAGIAYMEMERQREYWRHAERMKALDRGINPYRSPWAVATACTAIGAGVPVGLAIAVAQSATGPWFEASSWAVVFFVGTAALIAATLLGRRGFETGRIPMAPTEPADREADAAKPAPGPEAHDFAGYRG